MSQYSVSLRAYIHMLDKYKNNSATFADYAKKVIYGRSLFFSFDYAGDVEFKQLFEESFINKYFDCDVAYEDFNRFLFKLKTDTQRKAPVYYKMYTDVKNAENMLKTAGIIETSNESSSEHSTNSGNASSSGTSKNKSSGSAFPNDIETAADFDDVKYMDSGSRSESESNTGSTSSGSSDTTHSAERRATHEHTGDLLQKITEFQRMEADIVESFVNSFNNLFCLLW